MKDFTEYEKAGEFELAEEGEYELVLHIVPGKTKDGAKDYLSLDFQIRDDVDQRCKKVHIFDKAWRDTDDPDWFDSKKLGKILFTQKNKKGFKPAFDEQDELTQYLNGIHLIAYVEKKYDDYYGKEANSIKYLSYKPSVWDITHPVTEEAPAKEEKPVVNEAAEKLMNDPAVKDPDCPF